MESLKGSDDIENLLVSIEDELNVQLEKQSLDEVKKLLRERCQFYREENAKLEAAIKKLGRLKQGLCPQAQKSIEDLSNVQNKHETKECTSEAITLSHTERLRKHSNYITKIKMCIKMYMNINDKLTKDIKLAKSEMENTKCTMKELCILSKEELKSLEAKIKRYENELLKFEKKYPWLTNSQFNLPNISKEMETLANLRKVKTKLLEELNPYQGLQPDIEEAKQQLNAIQLEHEELTKKILNN